MRQMGDGEMRKIAATMILLTEERRMAIPAHKIKPKFSVQYYNRNGPCTVDLALDRFSDKSSNQDV